MCIRYLKINKDLVFKSPHLENLIRLWITGIGIEHIDAVHTHAEFFMVLVDTVHNDIKNLNDITNE